MINISEISLHMASETSFILIGTPTGGSLQKRDLYGGSET